MIGLGIWGRFYDAAGNKITVPAPSTDSGAKWLWVLIRQMMPHLGPRFDFFQSPPFSMAQGGDGAGCDGYGVAQRWNLGWQQPTRYGYLEDLLAMIGAANSYGAKVFGDLVLHQILGPENGGPGISNYTGADGKTLNGRGSTTAGWFRGNTQWDATTKTYLDAIPPFCVEDQVPNRSSDVPFGREVSHQHCSPSSVTIQDGMDLIRFLKDRLGVSDWRIDDAKGMYSPATAMFLDTIRAIGGSSCAEYFDNTANALGWAIDYPIDSMCAIEDMDWHFRLMAACNSFDARLLFEGGNCAWQERPDLSKVFVENADTDTSPGMQVVSNKGIAYMLTLPLPAREAEAYGKDYFPASVWPGAYGLQPLIDNIAWIARMFAFGAYETRWLDKDVIAYTRDGNGGPVGWSGGLLVASNFNVLAARTITVQTPFGANRWLHDYTGHHGDIWTNENGQATFTIPSNAYSGGVSYVAFAPGGVNEPVAMSPRETVQTFVGDGTIDTLRLVNGMNVMRQRFACAAGTEVEAALTLDQTTVAEGASVQVEVIDPAGSILCWATAATLPNAVARGKTTKDGWHTVRLVGNLLPAAGVEFNLTMTYTGTTA